MIVLNNDELVAALTKVPDAIFKDLASYATREVGKVKGKYKVMATMAMVAVSSSIVDVMLDYLGAVKANLGDGPHELDRVLSVLRGTPSKPQGLLDVFEANVKSAKTDEERAELHLIFAKRCEFVDRFAKFVEDCVIEAFATKAVKEAK